MALLRSFWHTSLGTLDLSGRRTDFFDRPRCRLKAAFRLASERCLQAAAKNPVLGPI